MVDIGGGKKTSPARADAPSFGEIVGQAELKRALLTVAANDGLDGLLVRGEKGTAKSTAVRALTDLLPPQVAVKDCPYGCPPDAPARQCADCRERTDPPATERPVPLVTLPLGATRERVVGTLSVADALGGDQTFDPGLLARANRGILYVDEVNLLDDHLVDVVLDAAASRVNRVERDGVSVSHPAEFTLVGTMNPEEGDLRPQLRDRFALQATVAGCRDVDRRVEIIDRVVGLAARGADASDSRDRTDDHRERLMCARTGLDDVVLPRGLAEEIAALCRDAGVDGHRGDIAIARTARTFAAMDGRKEVVRSDLREAAELALPHRLQSRPFEDAPDPDDVVDDHFEGDDTEDDTSDEASEEGGDAGNGDGASRAPDDGSADEPEGGNDTEREEAGSPSDADPEESSEPSRPDDAAGDRRDETGADGEAESAHGAGTEPEEKAGDETEDPDGAATPLVPGRSEAGVGESRAPELSVSDSVERSSAETGSRSARPDVDADGPRVRARRANSSRRIDAAASVRAAGGRGADSVASRDLRQSVRRGSASTLVLFVVDASASMRPAMRAAKGTVLELLQDAYRHRDEVGFVAFAGEDAEVLLPPTTSVSLAARHLKELPTGDRTPLPAGLRTAGRVLDRADPAASVVVLVTDGRANVAAGSPVEETREAAGALAKVGARVLVVDAGEDDRTTLTESIVDETDGERVPLSALSADRVDAAAGAARESEI